jgi:hypothetical protein
MVKPGADGTAGDDRRSEGRLGRRGGGRTRPANEVLEELARHHKIKPKGK